MHRDMSKQLEARMHREHRPVASFRLCQLLVAMLVPVFQLLLGNFTPLSFLFFRFLVCGGNMVNRMVHSVRRPTFLLEHLFLFFAPDPQLLWFCSDIVGLTDGRVWICCGLGLLSLWLEVGRLSKRFHKWARESNGKLKQQRYYLDISF